MSRNKEGRFQSKLRKEMESRYKDCIVMKQDADYRQGIPDLVIFYKDKWAMLEVKDNANAHHQKNQGYYVDLANKMSFGAFIFPENKDEVLDELDKWFGVA